MIQTKREGQIEREVLIPSGRVYLEGELKVPAGASGVVLFAHGSGSSRHSPRNKYVARVLQDYQIGTLLFDLLQGLRRTKTGLPDIFALTLTC